MNTNFSRIITLLRKEQGISQKKAAADLGVSQALLSHYEKGIRECGLDFVVRVADYYHVSCDYLLGRTADKEGAILSVDNIPDGLPGESDAVRTAGPALHKKLIVNSLHVLFDMLQRSENAGVTAYASAYLSLCIYAVFRTLYAANPKNLPGLFSLSDDTFRMAAAPGSLKELAGLMLLCAGKPCGGYEPLSPAKAPLLLPDQLSRDYPLFAASLLGLLKNAEDRLD